MHRRTVVLWIVVALAVSVVDWVTPDASAPESPRASHHVRAGFRNVDPQYSYPLLTRATHALRAPAQPRGEPLFVEKNDGAALRGSPRGATLTWVGASSDERISFSDGDADYTLTVRTTRLA